MFPMGKPIIALATPPLKGALAVIRLTGDGVFEIADALFSKKISGIQERTIFLGNLHDESGKTIDQVVLLAYPAPRTMTGEDVVEVMPHGSMLIVNEIIAAFLAKGCVYATRGEFSARAFYNGKMDLVEAEAVNDLINATTVEAKDLALQSLNGASSKLIAPVEQEIADLMALVEVGIDFPEYEDIESASEAKIIEGATSIIEKVDELIKDGQEGRIIKNGVNVALVGEPNVGKSSLLNALLEQEKAIVSPIPGTTRDIVEGDLSVHGVPLHLLDTAGIRDASDVIENLGVERSEKAIEDADLVILVLDASREELTAQEKEILEKAKKKKLIVCYNKEDLAKKHDDKKLYISALKNDVQPLKEAIFQTLSLSDDAFHKPSLSNPRQLSLLRKIKEEMLSAKKEAENGAGMDIISLFLQAAYNAARSLLGKGETNDLQDEIFSRFCVGK